MHKTFLNLFLIVIICFLASIMPLNTNQVLFPTNFFTNFTLSKPSNEIEAISSSYETNLNETNLYNPTNIEFIMISELDKGSFVLGDSHDMVLEVFNNGSLVKKYTNTEFVTGLVSVDDENLQIKYSFDISQENLELSSGNYNFKIYSTGEIFNNVKPYEIFVTYINLTNSKYISSNDTVEDGQLYLTLYFPDENYKYLIPVSRKIPYTDKITRTSINNLTLGPDSSLGLSNDSPVPKVPKVWVKNKTAYLYLPNNIGKYDEDSTLSQFALDSFINTLIDLDGVDSVKFLKGGREVNTFFNGANVKDVFKKTASPEIFLGFETTTERILLAPVRLNESNTEVDNLVPKVFNSLKTCVVDDTYHNELLATIPDNIELLSFEYNDGKLTLNFNSYFLQSYDERIDLQQMMLESILYSFTSIPQVNSVSIIVDGNPVDFINNIDSSQPLDAPQFINVEK